MSRVRDRPQDRARSWPDYAPYVVGLTLAAAILGATFVAVFAAAGGRGVSMRVVVPSIGGQAPELQVIVSPRTSLRPPPPAASSASSGSGGGGGAGAGPAGGPTAAPSPTPLICTSNLGCVSLPEAPAEPDPMNDRSSLLPSPGGHAV